MPETEASKTLLDALYGRDQYGEHDGFTKRVIAIEAETKALRDKEIGRLTYIMVNPFPQDSGEYRGFEDCRNLMHNILTG